MKKGSERCLVYYAIGKPRFQRFGKKKKEGGCILSDVVPVALFFSQIQIKRPF